MIRVRIACIAALAAGGCNDAGDGDTTSSAGDASSSDADGGSTGDASASTTAVDASGTGSDGSGTGSDGSAGEDTSTADSTSSSGSTGGSTTATMTGDATGSSGSTDGGSTADGSGDTTSTGTTSSGTTSSGTSSTGTTGAALVWVRVATWNIETVGDPGTDEHLAAAAVLGRIDADVVALNEISSAADATNLDALAVTAGYANVVVPPSNPFGADRNAILSRLPVIDSVIHTSADLSEDLLANDITRLLVQVTVDVPGASSDLVVVSNHWKSGTGNDDEFRRVVESFRSAQVVEDLDSDLDAFIILGDINEERDNVPQTPDPFVSEPSGLPGTFDLGSDLEALLPTPGLDNDPFVYLEGLGGPGLSAQDAVQLDGDDATRPASGRRLDYAFLSRALQQTPPMAEVYDSTDEGIGGGLPKGGAPLAAGTSLEAADHLPVLVDVVVP